MAAELIRVQDVAMIILNHVFIKMYAILAHSDARIQKQCSLNLIIHTD